MAIEKNRIASDKNLGDLANKLAIARKNSTGSTEDSANVSELESQFGQMQDEHNTNYLSPAQAHGNAVNRARQKNASQIATFKKNAEDSKYNTSTPKQQMLRLIASGYKPEDIRKYYPGVQ